MTSRKFGQFLTPLLHRHAFYYKALVLLSRIIESPKDRDVIYGRPQMQN